MRIQSKMQETHPCIIVGVVVNLYPWILETKSKTQDGDLARFPEKNL